MKFTFTRRLKAALLVGALAIASLMVWSGMQTQDSTLEIRASRQGGSVPDGFYVWHHLDANGIRFKSITPLNNTLLVTFDSSAQSEAAKEVLNRTLPQGYVIAQQEGDKDALAWLSILRPDHNHLG
ncbi:Modulator protein MzrA [Cedecea lapagei]|uniref:Modulator protein MzrA n=1 Tax=Cedecea lapagei TaxID=158823 RepID=A0A447V784_9ENTR|nr:EnvZ/OmpR regulon moderator MzrA [Cedecea lapagei]VEC01113.1 Modulator protein MzrA [Cedecea lapagei]